MIIIEINATTVIKKENCSGVEDKKNDAIKNIEKSNMDIVNIDVLIISELSAFTILKVFRIVNRIIIAIVGMPENIRKL